MKARDSLGLIGGLDSVKKKDYNGEEGSTPL